jgi:hypothetical protein
VQVVRPNSSMVGPHVMLALVISKIFHSGVPFEFAHILATLSLTKKILFA